MSDERSVAIGSANANAKAERKKNPPRERDASKCAPMDGWMKGVELRVELSEHRPSRPFLPCASLPSFGQIAQRSKIDFFFYFKSPRTQNKNNIRL
jgi:hypothetical protein